MKEFFVKYLTRVFGTKGKENVSANEFMDNFAVGRETTEANILIIQLNHHHLDFPVHVPCLQNSFQIIALSYLKWLPVLIIK